MWRKTQLKRRKLLRRASLREWHKKLGKGMASKRIFYLFGLISRNPWGNSREDEEQKCWGYLPSRSISPAVVSDTLSELLIWNISCNVILGVGFLKKDSIRSGWKDISHFFPLPFHHEIPVLLFYRFWLFVFSPVRMSRNEIFATFF